MATTLNQRTDSGTVRPDSESSRPAPRRGSGSWIFFGLLVVAVLVVIALFMPQIVMQ